MKKTKLKISQPMLHKGMTGRLGNQMFRYAAVRAFQKKYAENIPINLNFSAVYKNGSEKDGFRNQLIDFNIKECYVDKPIELNMKQFVLFYAYTLYDKILKNTAKSNYLKKKIKYESRIQGFYQKHGLYIFSIGYRSLKDSREKNKVFTGYYESPKYFDDIKDILQKEFTPRRPERPENKNLYKAIRSNESVCVSIRRGDFLIDRHKADHYICTPEYFEKGIKIMKNKVKNPKFIIFSDDIEWCKDNLKFPKGTLFESGKDPVWEKLRLMYSYKHFIVSNSTFSWWAQYLTRNKNKVVIAPSRWNNNVDFGFIYQDEWVKVEP